MKKSLIIRLLVLSLSCLMLLSCFSAALAEAVPTDAPAQATETAAEDASSTRTKAIAAAALVRVVFSVCLSGSPSPLLTYNALFVPIFAMFGLLCLVMSALFRQAAELKAENDLII